MTDTRLEPQQGEAPDIGAAETVEAAAPPEDGLRDAPGDSPEEAAPSEAPSEGDPPVSAGPETDAAAATDQPVAEESAIEDSGPEDSGPANSGAEDAVTEDPVLEGPGPEDSGPEDSGSEGPDGAPAPLDALRAAVLDACARLEQAARGAEVDFIRGQIGDLRAHVSSVRPADLTPRRGLGGLFDSRRRRLIRFRAHVVDLAPAVGAATVKLRDAAAAAHARYAVLDAGHEALRAAVADLSAAGAPGPEGQSGVRCLALARMVQNVDARLAETAEQLSAAAQTWRDGMLQALGADGKKLAPIKRVRADQGALTAACETLTDAIDRAEAALAPARTRRDDVLARMARARPPAPDQDAAAAG